MTMFKQIYFVKQNFIKSYVYTLYPYFSLNFKLDIIGETEAWFFLFKISAQAQWK